VDKDPARIGTLTEVSGATFTARLDTLRTNVFDPYRQVGDEQVTVGQVGAHVIVRAAREKVLCQIIRVWTGSYNGRIARHMALLPLGELDADGAFGRGVRQFPPLDAGVYIADSQQLEAMFDSVRRTASTSAVSASAPTCRSSSIRPCSSTAMSRYWASPDRASRGPSAASCSVRST
jgi:uncharacterized protein